MADFIVFYLMGCVIAGLLVTHNMKGRMENHVLDYTSTKGYNFTSTMLIIIAVYSIGWPFLLYKMFVSLKEKE